MLKTKEYETKIEDPESMLEIFKKLNLIKKVTVTKHRKYFEYENFVIVLDCVEELGCFLEIEARNHPGSHDEIKKKCFEVLEKLNIEGELVNKGYPDMIIEKD